MIVACFSQRFSQWPKYNSKVALRCRRSVSGVLARLHACWLARVLECLRACVFACLIVRVRACLNACVFARGLACLLACVCAPHPHSPTQLKVGRAVKWVCSPMRRRLGKKTKQLNAIVTDTKIIKKIKKIKKKPSAELNDKPINHPLTLVNRNASEKRIAESYIMHTDPNTEKRVFLIGSTGAHSHNVMKEIFGLAKNNEITTLGQAFQKRQELNGA